MVEKPDSTKEEAKKTASDVTAADRHGTDASGALDTLNREVQDEAKKTKSDPSKLKGYMADVSADLVKDGVLPDLAIEFAKGQLNDKHSFLAPKGEGSIVDKEGDITQATLKAFKPQNEVEKEFVSYLEKNFAQLSANDSTMTRSDLRADSAATAAVPQALVQQAVMSDFQQAATVQSGEGYWESAQRLLSLGGSTPSNSHIAELTNAMQANSDVSGSTLYTGNVLIDQNNLQNILAANPDLASVYNQVSGQVATSLKASYAGTPASDNQPANGSSDQPSNSNPADMSNKQYEALMKNLSTADGDLSDTPGGADTSVWPLSQAISATLAEASLKKAPDGTKAELTKEFQALSRYWVTGGDGPPGYAPTANSPDSLKFYDDNAWVGIDQVEGYKTLKDPALLNQAKQVFSLIQSGWESSNSDDPGGEQWTQLPGHDGRTAVSTAGGEQLALQLYSVTHDKTYLDFAQKANNWMNEYMRNPTTGLYYDHIDGNGTVDKGEVAYNQGLMLGNSAMLYQATGDQQYLKDAQAIATSSIAHYQSVGSYPAYMGIFSKNLELLNTIKPDPAYTQALDKYAQQISDETNSSTGMLDGDFGVSTMISQAAAIQIEAEAAKANGS